MQILPKMFAEAMRQNGERIAIVDNEATITYAELGKEIAILARELHETGVHPGDRIALLLPNGLEFVRFYFAIVAAGAIVVPLNDHYQESELLYFLETCGVSVLITSKNHHELCHRVLSLRQSPTRLFMVEDHPVDSSGDETFLTGLWSKIDPGAPVMYQFSSGTTGQPKRIARTHRNLIFELNNLVQTLEIKKEDRFLGVAPFSHVNGLMRTMMASLWAGATLYPFAKFERRAAAMAIEKHQLSVFIGVPFQFSMLAQANFHKRPDFTSLRFCISASAPMPVPLNLKFQERFGLFVRQLYGSTETGTISVNLNPHVKVSLASVGKPIERVEVKVFTEDGNIADTDQTGELAICSPGMIEGYENLPEVNREVFRNGYFFTGDLGRKDADGLLYLVGRKKFFINKGRYKINPHDIEELLQRHPAVEEIVVIGEPTSYGDERVKAIIVQKVPVTEAELIEFCRGKIADFKIPVLIEFRDILPKSPTGKIRRKLLTE